MKPNANTAGGTTALMLAARDAEKVKVLIDAGADVNARGKFGFTALMVAARYRGNSESVRLLLKNGAKVKPDKDVKVENNAAIMYCGDQWRCGDSSRASMRERQRRPHPRRRHDSDQPAHGGSDRGDTAVNT